jgi:hypothetical protein
VEIYTIDDAIKDIAERVEEIAERYKQEEVKRKLKNEIRYVY